MFVYNISFQIAPNLEMQWLEWMKSKMIPLFESTNCFTENKFYKLDVEKDQAPTYTLQLFATTQSQLDKSLTMHDDSLLKELSATWGDQCFHFATKMQIVN